MILASMVGSFKLKLSFAQWLLAALVTFNVVGGVVVVLNTARTESAAIETGRLVSLHRTADILVESIAATFSGFGGERRREIIDSMTPVIYANPELDLMGFFLVEEAWDIQAWTREDGADSLAEVLPNDVAKQLVASESKEMSYNNFHLVARPIMQYRKRGGTTDLVGHLILGQDRNKTTAELLPRIKKLVGQLGLLVVIQTAIVAVFLDRKLRRPLERISKKTAVVEQENSELAEEFSNLGDLARIEKATELLGQSRTEFKQQKEKAEKAQHLAEQAAAAKASFLANMSHEIRTPMNGVMGLLELVSDSDLNAQQSSMIKTARVSAESLLNVLNDILDISKIEAGKVDLEQTEFDIKAIFEDVVTLFHVAAIDKGIELSCFVDPLIKKCVVGDPTRLRQIVSNIVGNAVKFTMSGEVEVRLDVRERLNGKLKLAISVRDTGIGMSEEALGKLFAPFSQADESTTRKFGGTGLGLAISKQLVELMGGAISATSKPGVGTTFTVNLDLEVGEHSPASKIDVHLLSSINVLVVDDNQTNREILGAYLSNWNIKYSSAKNAEQALEMLNSESERPFDICLLDYHMPDIDGVELARKIQATDCAPNMVMALLSSGAAKASELKEVGIYHSLNKPIRQIELFELIARCLDITLSKEDQVVEVQESFSGKVLLVEDNKVNQMVAKSLLEKLGLTVELAVDGFGALEAMAAASYDLVFMDCLMPKMDGYEATDKRRALEREKRLQRMTIIALTANAMSGDREKCLDVGMDDFLSKPIKLDEMKEKIHYWLSNQSNMDGQSTKEVEC